MLRSEFDPIVVDIETAPHPCATEFLEPLNLDAITAARNLKDPQKIADDLAKRRADAEAEHLAKLSRAALDWNLSRIVALAWSIDGQSVIAKICRDETQEADALTAFWAESQGRDVIGFCIRTFDAPTLMQRSRLLNIDHRALNLARFGKGSVIDLRDVLTFDDARYEALMPRSLKMFCKRFGVPVDDAINGAEIPELVAADRWDDVISHVTSDVLLTIALAKRLGLLEIKRSEPVEVF